MWRLFAFKDADEDGNDDERRVVAEWQIDDAIRWARYRGYDHIYLCRTPSTREFRKAPAPPGIRLHPGNGIDIAGAGTEGSGA